MRCVGVCVRSPRRACVASCRPGGLEEKLAVFCCRGKNFADELAYLVDLLVTLWMAWYPQVRDCCGLGGGFGRVSGPV